MFLLIGLLLACRAPDHGLDDPGAAETALARETVVATVLGRPAPPPPDLGPARPVFVTIERKGRVIGCRGSLTPRTEKLSDEIALAARSAAAHDPRYGPVHRADLESFRVTVTVIRSLDSIDGVADLRPEDGLVLTSGGRSGVVLPWEGRDPELRLRWAYRKAGVSEGTPATLRRMVADRWPG